MLGSDMSPPYVMHLLGGKGIEEEVKTLRLYILGYSRGILPKEFVCNRMPRDYLFVAELVPQCLPGF